MFTWPSVVGMTLITLSKYSNIHKSQYTMSYVLNGEYKIVYVSSDRCEWVL